MKKIFKFFPVAFAAFALASCSSDDLMSFGQDAEAIPEVGANEAYATLDFDGTTTRSGVNIGTGENAGKYQLTWSTGDKFNLYSTNSLKFNTYTLKGGAGSAKGTFEIKEGDAANLSEQFTDESVANSLYAVMDDSGNGMTHSFFSNAAGDACVSVEIPSRFSQVAGAKATADNATELCMPAFAKGVTVNAQGGVTASFKAMAGLLAIDAGKLSNGAVGVVVVAKGITGTFEACLDDENPSVKADARYTYGNYIQVDFDAAMTTGGARFIYVPVPEGTYKSLNVYEITGAPASNTDNFKKDAITADGLAADGSVNAAPTANTAASWNINTTAIISKTNYQVKRAMNDISQAVLYSPTAAADGVNSWATLSKYIYDKMDGSHSITVNIENPSAWTDGTLYIPVNEGKTKSSVEIVVPDAATKLTTATGGLTIVEATYNATTGLPENVTTNASVSAAAVKEVKLTLAGATTATIAEAVNAYLPTSTFAMDVAAAKTQGGTVTAITATDGLFINGGGTYTSVTTVAEKNTGAITVGTGATVTTLTLTKGDGAVTIDGTAKLAVADFGHSADITINGILSDGSSYGASLTPTAPAVSNTGNIIFADGAQNAGTFTNWGSGSITAGKLNTSYGTIVQKGNGAVTIGKAGSATEDVSAATVTAITMDGTGALTVQNISGAITAINLNATSASAVTLNNLTNATAVTIAATKSAVINATDAVIGTLTNSSTATSTLNTYGSTALSTLTDTNNKVTINAYYTGKAAAALGDNTTIYTAGQLAALGLKTKGTFTISPRVAIMYLGGAQNPWVGPSIATDDAFSLDGNSVKIQGMNLSATDVTGTKKINNAWANSVGLFRSISGTGAVTINELDLSDVYLKTTKADLNNIGILIGSYTSSGALTVGGAAAAAVKITDVEAIEAAGNNVGGLIGYYAGGNATINSVTVNASKIQTSGYNVGGLIGYQYAGTVTVGGTAAVTVNIPAIKGAYALGGMIGSNRAAATFTKATVTAKFGLTQEASYFSTSELKSYCGSVNNLVGLVYGDVTTDELKSGKTYVVNELSAADKTALLFDLNTTTSASGATRKFVGGNKVVGVVKSGTITVNGTVLANSNEYNKYE